MLVHLIMSGVLLITVIIFKHTLQDAAIWQLITLAGYTYGPLIALFFFGILTKRSLNQKWVISVCILAPVLTFFINQFVSSGSLTIGTAELFSVSAVKEFGFSCGATLIILNSCLTFAGLFLISQKTNSLEPEVTNK